MNVQEACAILEVPVGSSPEDVNKAFRLKAAKYHPDVNKEPNAEATFKKINEANQLLIKHGTMPASGFRSFNYQDDFVEELRKRMSETFVYEYGFRMRPSVEPIVVHIEIPFEMSVTGGTKEVSYERIVKCTACNSTLCQKCNGVGHRKYGKDKKTLPCTTCKGEGKIFTCNVCNGTRKTKKTEAKRVNIPAGVFSGSRLVLKGAGNIQDTISGNVIVFVNVLPDLDMRLQGDDVISTIELSLLEALKGTKKTLRTVKGENTLTFKPKTRNGDTVRVAGFGVPPNGAHIFVVNVTYPEDVSGLISVLEPEASGQEGEKSGL